VSTEHCKGNKTVPKTVATTHTEDGHRQNTRTSTAIQTERKKEHRATEEEMERSTSSGGSRNRLTCLNLHEHDDDDDDDEDCFQIFECFHSFKGTIIILYTVTLSCILILRHDNVLSFISIYF
jgi:hypothetical protein